MKKFLFPILIAFFVLGCSSDDDNNAPEIENLPELELTGVSYGSDPEQKMDVYLPANRNSTTKVFILVHGGGWSEGSRSDFSYAFPILKTQFPGYAIVNIDYRLGTAASPGFPKQIQDIEKVVQFLKDSDYQISDDYGLIGASAGAHLSLLYAYKYDPLREVKAVASIVGPTDFTDPAYTENPLFQFGLINLVGNENYQTNPAPFIAASPATHVSTTSPPTAMFYGGQDPLIPVSQATRLKEKLDQFDVYNEYYLYANGGHGDWDIPTTLDFQAKLIAFFNNKF